MLLDLLRLPPAELAQQLAMVAVEARTRKQAAAGMFDQAAAGVKGLWSAAQPTLQAYGKDLKGLNVSNPAVAATLGAAAMGGASAVGESFRRKDRRRWSNVAVNAALGGLLGGAAPLAIGGARSWLTPGADTPPPPPATGAAPGAAAPAPTVPPTLFSGWKTPPGETPPTLIDRTRNTAAAGGQVVAGGSKMLRDGLEPTNTNLDAARYGLDATSALGAGIRDNPMTALGVAGSAGLARHNSRWAARTDLDRGFSRLMGAEGGPNAAAEKLIAKVPDLPPPPQPPGPTASPADHRAYQNAQTAYATQAQAQQAAATQRAARVQGIENWVSQTNRQRHTSAGTALRRGFGGATATDFTRLRTSAGPSSFFGRTVPRWSANAAPALLGILMDHLSAPQNTPQ